MLVLAHLTLVAAYAGFQVTVRLLVYPQFALAGPGFVAYEQAHQHRVSLVVGPLFAALVVSTTAVAVRDRGPLGLLSAACLAVVLGVTWLRAVPEHRVLSRGFDGAALRRLLRADTLRTAAALVNVAAALGLALG